MQAYRLSNTSNQWISTCINRYCSSHVVLIDKVIHKQVENNRFPKIIFIFLSLCKVHLAGHCLRKVFKISNSQQ